MKFTKNDEAVSPVIGVILMVAITVILAAVIAAFVFGMAGGISNTKNVAATAQQQGTTIFITYQGGQDALDLDVISIQVDGSAATPIGTVDNSAADVLVGTTVEASAGTIDRNHVVAVATFIDGTSQVILDTYV